MGVLSWATSGKKPHEPLMSNRDVLATLEREQQVTFEKAEGKTSLESAKEKFFSSLRKTFREGRKERERKESEEREAALAMIPARIRKGIEAGRNLIIHGKAGTGKSTILRAIVAAYPNAVVLSPTGIAALNVGGQTLHSFFGLSFGFLTPRDCKAAIRQLKILTKRPLIIIDEISMVRSDVFAAISFVLRKTLDSNKAFAGLQVIALGDTGQLPPVVVEAEKQFFKDSSPMFFAAREYERAGFQHIELEHVYRQNNAQFVEFLSRVRDNSVLAEDIDGFNARVRIEDTDDVSESDDSVVLCMTNRTADTVNQTQYRKLDTPELRYEARVSGAFPEREFPTSETLCLKVGAKVVILRNSGDGKWVNGTTAIISRLEPKAVFVRIGDEEHELAKETWEKFKYVEGLEGIRKTVAGSFEQFPVKLAWAITVHKSQGMTLDRFHLDLSTPPFEHGQLYVALSRARRLSGITVSRKLMETDIKVNEDYLLGGA